MTLPDDPKELAALKAAIEAKEAELAKEPDWEAWRPAAEKACEVYFSCDTDSDVEDMARALQAALPLAPVPERVREVFRRNFADEEHLK